MGLRVVLCKQTYFGVIMTFFRTIRDTFTHIINKFNVDGVDYAIEPILDPEPVEGSQHGVESGGVYPLVQKTNIPEELSTKNFTAGGAWTYLKRIVNSLLSMATWWQGTDDNTTYNFNTVSYANGLWVAGKSAVHESRTDFQFHRY